MNRETAAASFSVSLDTSRLVATYSLENMRVNITRLRLRAVVVDDRWSCSQR